MSERATDPQRRRLALASVAFGIAGFVTGAILTMMFAPCGNVCEDVAILLYSGLLLFFGSPVVAAAGIVASLLGYAPAWASRALFVVAGILVVVMAGFLGWIFLPV